MEYYFVLDGTIDIEEPDGFSDIELSLLRDDKYHGIVNEASTSVLNFYGVAATYLQDKYRTEGVQANVTFAAYVSCGAYELQEILSGRLNFGKYKDTCGEECTVSIPWEKDSCAVTFNARFDQKIDVDRITAVDGITSLEDYAGLSQEIELPGIALQASVIGNVNPEGDVVDLAIFPNNTRVWFVRPTYGQVKYESINQSQLVPTNFAASNNGFSDPVLSPIMLLDEPAGCFANQFHLQARIKGSYNYTYNPVGAGDFDITYTGLMIGIGEFSVEDTAATFDQILLDEAVPHNDENAVGTFDFSIDQYVTITEGQGVHIFFQNFSQFSGGGFLELAGNVTFDPETFVDITNKKQCPATNAELYMVHETLSRVTESVTNGCARVKSQYYGRTDSQPFSFPSDGCGGLRAVTSGLKIRRAEEDNFFESPQGLIEGLNAIDNIGFDVVPDPDRDGNSLVRIEDVDFFYQEEPMLTHTFVPRVDRETEEQKHYSKINVGYKKWEVSQVNGLEEFNSTRQYNTSIDTINSTLDITSNLVAGSLPIETTRQQSFASTGAADTTYDNETFIISLRRTTYPYGNIEVETNNIDFASNIFSPETVYNFRLSPVRNLMRWYKTIAASFALISSSINQLFFTAGTGNLVATGQLDEAFCRLENTPLRENQNVFLTQFTDQAEGTPIWKNELLTYDYPMSLEDYFEIKANPYRYINLQCGKGEIQAAWVKEIKFKPVRGIATFILRTKYAV